MRTSAPLGSLSRFHLQLSRPGLWFPTVWLYLLPLTADGPAVGRSTTATALGVRRTKWLIIAVVGSEVALLAGPLGDPPFAAALGLFWLWLWLDQLVLFREGAYSVGLMKLFGVLSNLCAVCSMGWIWWRGGLG